MIIAPTFEMVKPASAVEGVEALRFCERMARISHRSEDAQTDESWARFIQFVVMQKGDWSITEHAHATVVFRVDRGVTHELVRHRLFSFTQESTRFVNYKKKGSMEFVRPAVFDAVENLNEDPTYLGWRDQMWQCAVCYDQLLEAKQSPQMARSVLPNALAATIAVTGNLRTWRHLLIMRTTKETHPDFKRVMIPLLAEFQERVPLLYDDIVADQKQSEALSKPQ